MQKNENSAVRNSIVQNLSTRVAESRDWPSWLRKIAAMSIVYAILLQSFFFAAPPVFAATGAESKVESSTGSDRGFFAAVSDTFAGFV